jgi:hypothetical protein
MDPGACEFVGKMVQKKEAEVREMNGKARSAAFKSILDIVNTLSKQVNMMMSLKKKKEAMLAEGKQQMEQMCGSKGAQVAQVAQGGNRYKKRNRKTYKKQKRGGRGKSRRRRKQKSKHRRTKRR